MRRNNDRALSCKKQPKAAKNKRKKQDPRLPRPHSRSIKWLPPANTHVASSLVRSSSTTRTGRSRSLKMRPLRSSQIHQVVRRAIDLARLRPTGTVLSPSSQSTMHGLHSAPSSSSDWIFCRLIGFHLQHILQPLFLPV